MTFSIVAFDGQRDEMGIAVHTQAFAAGPSVGWALAGCGVVATQSIVEPRYGRLGLAALRHGLAADEALAAARTVDPHPERRQVAVLDALGRLAVHTGSGCVAEAGQRLGPTYATIANMAASSTVWEAMAEAFETSQGPLADRLLVALESGEAAGGDLRGSRSAALLVVRMSTAARDPDPLVDLRVDDHPAALSELARLRGYATRYEQFRVAFRRVLDGYVPSALAGLEGIPPPDPRDEPDLCIWYAVVLAAAGQRGESHRVVAETRQHAPQFAELLKRYERAGLLRNSLIDERSLLEGP